MKKYTITVNGTAYEVEVEEAGVVASAPKAAPKAAPAPAPKAAPAPAPKAAAPVAAGATTVSAPDSGSYENAKRNHGSG